MKANNDKEVVEIINRASNKMAKRMMRRWNQLDQYLLVKYIDGNIKKEKDGKFLRTDTGMAAFPDQPEYPAYFYKAIVEDHGDIVIVK